MAKCFSINHYKYQAIFLIFLFMALFPLAKPTAAMSVVLNIPEKYSEVKVGEKLYFQTEVKWPENTGRKDLRVEYTVVDGSGTEIAYLKVLKAIETQASFMDSITISDRTVPGIYRINAKISDYGSLEQEVTTSFTVAKGETKPQTYVNIIIGLVFVIGIFLVNFIYTWNRSPKQKNIPGLSKF